MITGISRGTTTAHIARAALEGIAFQTYDIVKAMEKDSNLPIRNLKVDGGASRNNLLMQFQSDILATQQQWQLDAEFKPKAGKDEVNDKINGWHEAVKRDLTGTHPTPNS